MTKPQVVTTAFVAILVGILIYWLLTAIRDHSRKQNPTVTTQQVQAMIDEHLDESTAAKYLNAAVLNELVYWRTMAEIENLRKQKHGGHKSR